MKGTTTTLDMAYHWDKGGIFTKSDVGSYLYNNTLKPYALSEISPTSAIIPNTVDSLTYTSFESVNTIMEDPYTATFIYNSDNQRAKMEVKQNTTTILTRWYPENSYIKETASGTTKEYTFIGGDAYTAPVVAISQSGTTTYYYLLRDHLGSITHVVDAVSGTLSYQYSYDAWGRMRTPTGWVNYNPGSEPALFNAGRGFTGHEHLPWFNLINMLSEVEELSERAKSRERSDSGNGRVYDPLTGQFLSPDNNVQSPDFTQNFNRYAYCLNNPLKYTDEDGEFWHLIFGAIIGGVSNWLAHGADFTWEGLKYFGVGAAAGAIGAGIGAGVSSALAAATAPAGALGSVGSAFTSGFVGTSTNTITGIAGGFISGTAGGFSGGFVSGAGNALIEGKNILKEGWSYGWKGALIGGVAGGIAGGIDAAKNGRNILTGANKQQGVVKIYPDGNADFTGNGDFKINGDYDTPLVNGENIEIQGNHVEISLPKNVNGYNLGNQGLKSTATIDSRTIFIKGRFLSFDAINDIVPNDVIRHLGVFRYYSNPINSFGDFFHYRPISSISNWF